MASAAFEISVAGGSFADPPQDASGGDEIILRLKSTTGADRGIAWRCFGTHDPAVSMASIQALMDAGLGGSPNGQTCTFTLPAGTGQAYAFECKVNGGIDSNGDAQSGLVQTGKVSVLNSQGVRPIAVGETFENDATHGFIPLLNVALNTAGGGGLSAPGASDDGKVAIADTEDLVYDFIADANVGAAAAIAVTKLAPSGTANHVVKTNSGATALEHGLLANANIDASAAIAVTKIANGAANTVVKTNSGGTALETGLIANANVATAAAVAVSKLASGTAHYVVKTNAAGSAVESGQIVNASVDNSAAIAGTKISPDFGSQNITTTGDVSAASYSTGGSPPTGVGLGLENADEIAWNGASSGTATITLDASDQLIHETIAGHSAQLAPKGFSGGYDRRDSFRVTGADNTPFTLDVPTPSNTEGTVEFAGLMRGLASDDNTVICGVAGYKNVSGTVTYFGSAGMNPYDSGSPADGWTVLPSASGANVRITFTGSAAVGNLVATGAWRLTAGPLVT